MRQRALGVLVLLALASILLPLLLDFRSGYEVDPSTRIPPAPDIQPLPRLDTLADPPASDGDVPVAQRPEPEGAEPGSAPARRDPPFDLPQPDAPSAASGVAAIPREPGLDAQGMPRAWVLQLGAFSEEKNALDLRDRLVAAGHRAFVQRAKPGQAPAYRVFVGPKMTQEQLAAEQRELERTFKIKPMVVPFAP